MKNQNIAVREISIVSRSNFMGQEVDVYGTAYEPLFRAKDVAGWLDIQNVSDMLKNIDEDEKGIVPTYTPGGVQSVWFLTEDGLYEVLMQSRKPIAKQFKKGVKDILKTIRRTGEFKAQPQQSPSQPKLSDKIQAAKDLLLAHNVKMSSAEFNKILVSKGIVERMTRPGKGGKTHSWVVIPEKFEKFGQNARNPHAQNQTQALWYDNKFSELLALAGIQEGKEEESHDQSRYRHNPPEDG